MNIDQWAAALLITAAAAAQVQAQAPAPAQTVQQQFDAAAEAMAAERYAEALATLEALESRLTRARDQRSLAIVRVRRGQVLHRLNRLAEAETVLRAALPLLPAGDDSLSEDRFLGHLALAGAAELRLDYRAAAADYRAAAAIPVAPEVKLSLYRGLIQTQMFHDAPAALASADEALRLAASAAERPREWEGLFRTLRGRVLLNMGRTAEARQELELAVRRLGGLGSRVNVRDLVARSDMSIAALLAGDANAARRYLAHTGAGRMADTALPFANQPPPACGDGLSPSDVAVVELGIRPDGTVAAATPVYASVQGDAAVRFARAALAWSWLPEEIATDEPIFRAAVRVELRCTNNPAVHERARASDIELVSRWAAARGIPVELVPARNATAAQMRADLASAEARHGAASPQLLQPLLRLGRRDDIPHRQRAELLQRALPIAIREGAPGPYIAMVAGHLAGARHQAAGRGWESPVDYLAVLPALGGAADSYAAAMLHLHAFDHLFALGRAERAADMLARLEALPGFGPDHPLRPQFAERRAAAAMAAGDAAAAARIAAGVPAAAWECGVPPQRQRTAYSNDTDFPNEAMAWGFEGWAIMEAQVGPDGRPAPIRTLIAYPPFVFGAASERIVNRFRFAPAVAPGGRACTTHVQRVVYRLPGGAAPR